MYVQGVQEEFFFYNILPPGPCDGLLEMCTVDRYWLGHFLTTNSNSPVALSSQVLSRRVRTNRGEKHTQIIF